MCSADCPVHIPTRVCVHRGFVTPTMSSSNESWPFSVSSSRAGRHPVLMFRSRTQPDRVIEFKYQKTGSNGKSFHTCTQCSSLKRANRSLGDVPRITVIGDKAITDPESPQNPHFCVFKKFGDAYGKRARYEVHQQLREEYTMPPKTALIHGVEQLGRRKDLSEEQKDDAKAAFMGSRGFKPPRRASSQTSQPEKDESYANNLVEEYPGALAAAIGRMKPDLKTLLQFFDAIRNLGACNATGEHSRMLGVAKSSRTLQKCVRLKRQNQEKKATDIQNHVQGDATPMVDEVRSSDGQNTILPSGNYEKAETKSEILKLLTATH